jgi:hypothetical protein
MSDLKKGEVWYFSKPQYVGKFLQTSFCELRPWPWWKRLLHRLVGWPRVRFKTITFPRVQHRDLPNVDIRRVLEANSVKERDRS